MFKLIKILNSGANVPEPIKLPKALGTGIKMGSALTLSGGVVENCSATVAPAYIAVQNAAEEDTAVLCYAVNENMLFETTVSASPTSIVIGSKLTLGKDGDGAALNVTATTASGVATVIDLMGAKAAGDKVTVKF